MKLPLWSRLLWIFVAVTVVLGHVALWLSPRVDPDAALRLTLMNAGIWAVVLLPIAGVSMWARQHRPKGSDRQTPQSADRTSSTDV